jgi:demethylmenaquinone methyltransferase/2-methoxy-6-polyprenyl-1,4-benzoquinol methylase
MRVPGLRDRLIDLQRSDHVLAPFLADAASRAGAPVTVEPAAPAALPRSIHIEDVLHEQSGYYEARAPEYDDVWFRRGRYDLGPDGNARWFAETARLEAAVDAAVTSGDVLELACGTGLFTRRLARTAHRLTAIDASAAVLAINAERVGDPRVRYHQADIFGWEPPRGRHYDHIFFGFFLSHVPPHLLEGLWERLARWLAPGGHVSFCDDAPGVDRRPSNPGTSVEDGPSWAHRRRLQDGREFTIVKVCHAPETLATWLHEHGWRADIAPTGDEFIFGTATPR